MSYKIGIITSTTRRGRSGVKVAEWFAKTAAEHSKELDYTILDVADVPLMAESNLPGMQQYEDQSTKDWSAKVGSMDGFVIVLGEYNHSFPAPIKNALDTVLNEWNRKAVGFVGYGSYGAESAIMALRPVISYLNMMPIGPTLRITQIWEALDENGTLKDGYLQGDVEKFVSELEWWTQALASKSN